MRNKSLPPAIASPIDETTRPETDYEHSQRFLNDIDRRTFQGTHPPTTRGPRGIVHKIAVASNVPHIYQDK